MIEITTATGKTFQSDYAVALPDLAFVRIVDQTLEEVQDVFDDPAELPLEGYEQFITLASVFQEPTGIKLILTP